MRVFFNHPQWHGVEDDLAAQNVKWRYTAQQCKDKFKEICKQYVKTKDHNRQSGNSPATWKFYEELDKIFGDKPCVASCSIASSFIYRKRTASPGYLLWNCSKRFPIGIISFSPKYLIENLGGNIIIPIGSLFEQFHNRYLVSSESNGENPDDPSSCDDQNPSTKVKKSKLQKELETRASILRTDAEKREVAREKRHQESLKIFLSVMNKPILKNCNDSGDIFLLITS